MMTQKWMAEIAKREKAIAKERDRVADLVAHMEEHRDNLDESLEHLVDARDALSRLV